MDQDGAQRFRYPDERNSLVTPRALDETRSSITVPLYITEVTAPSHLQGAVSARSVGTP